MLKKIKRELLRLKNPSKAKMFLRFFKTGKGEYGEGDVFLGITVPLQRSIAKKYLDLNLKDVQDLLSSKIHEHRLVSLLILIFKYKKADELEKKEIVDFYLKNTKNINNWDLVDLSAGYIDGDYLFQFKKDTSVLYKLAKSKNLWERRIAIMSTFAYIKNDHFKDVLSISEILLNDPHDLIHKAVGWMLREIGKRNKKVEVNFLNKHYREMPRTMLRYAIEKFTIEEKSFYMKKDAI